MPFVKIQLRKGRTDQQKEEIAKGILDLMEEKNFAKREVIQVIFEDMEPGDYYPGADN